MARKTDVHTGYTRIFNGKKYEYYDTYGNKREVEKWKKFALNQGYKNVRVTHGTYGSTLWVR